MQALPSLQKYTVCLGGIRQIEKRQITDPAERHEKRRQSGATESQIPCIVPKTFGASGRWKNTEGKGGGSI